MNDERQTPKWLFDKLDRVFNFTLDAAANSANALCVNYFDKQKDGLQQIWIDEIVWCNPPYSRGQLIQWVQKASNSVAKTLMLIPGDCSTKASQLALVKATAVLFLDRRLAFDDEKAGAKFCSWIVLFNGNEDDVYSLVGLEIGVVLP